MSLVELAHALAPIMLSDAPKASGIYAIYSACNDRWYIGSAKNFRTRLSKHKRDLDRDDPDRPHGNPHLQNSWNEHGEDAFAFFIVEECPIDQLLVREQYYLDLNFLNPHPYNINRTAGSRLGMTNSPEHNSKISVANKGRKATDEAKENMREAFKGRNNGIGRVHSLEHRTKISATLMGHEVTDESREKMRESATGRKASLETRERIIAALTGRPVSEETRERMSKAQKGHEVSLEQREKISEALTGRTLTPERIAKVADANRGRKNTTETIEKMKIAAQAREARKREAALQTREIVVPGQTQALEVP